MRPAPFLVAILFLTACGGDDHRPATSDRSSPLSGSTFEPLALSPVDDNVRHDTLLVQVTFDLGDGTFVMAASNVKETFEGLRLYRYTLLPDSNARVTAISAPAYDSWTMYPTFFRHPKDPSSLIVLANFGERESWGQKMMRLDASGFHDLGFLDVALPERVTEDDTLRLKRRPIADLIDLGLEGDGLRLTFNTDSLYLYDDLRGGSDRVVPAKSVIYRLGPSGLELGIDGEFRTVKVARS